MLELDAVEFEADADDDEDDTDDEDADVVNETDDDEDDEGAVIDWPLLVVSDVVVGVDVMVFTTGAAA